ncbi:MAG TPA: hypothetical protein VN231_04980 [Allosphingosinicella sp.]|nr:hypothetical protein [Allosphingosinicella sp.]
MARSRILGALAAAALVAGCAGGNGFGLGPGRYGLVRPGPESVAGGRMTVTPTLPWNQARRSYGDIAREENWTLNGPLLDSLSFIGGVESGKAIVRQRRRAERQVPRFRADMSPPEIASMIETFYRIRAGSVRFEMTGLQPRTFLGRPGFQFDYDHLDVNEIERRGRAVGAVIDERFYLILFDAARMHYFPAALPEFERIVESARLSG